MPDRGEMDTNLMCAPGVQVRAQQVSRIEARQPGEVRPRRPSSTDDRHALSVSRIASDRLVDGDAVFGDVAPRQRRVATYDTPRLQLGPRHANRTIRLGHGQQAGRRLLPRADAALASFVVS